MRLLFSIFIFLFLISCFTRNEKQKTNDIPINSNKNIQTIVIPKNNVMEADSIIDNLDYIILEHTEKSMVSTITAMRVCDGRIYILDCRSNSLFIFRESDGKFIQKIGEHGKGPREFLFVVSFAIDNKNKRLYLGDNYKSNCQVYDLDGNYIKEIKFNFTAGNIAIQNNGNIIQESAFSTLGIDPVTFVQKENIEIMDTTGKQLYYGFDYDYNRKLGSFTPRLYTDERDNVTFAPVCGDTIYSIENNAITPIYALNFKTSRKVISHAESMTFDGYSIDVAEMQQNRTYFMGKHVNCEKYLYLSTGHLKPLHIFHSKETNNTICFEKLVGEDADFIYNVADFNDGKFYGYVNDYHIKINYLDQKSGLKMAKLLKKLGDDYNPIIVKFKLKKY